MSEIAQRPVGKTGATRWLGQLLLYGLFALVIGVFSHWPPYRHLQPDQALIKLSFTHVGKPVGDCRKPGAEELAKLPPQMRPTSICPRERSPVIVELDIDGVNRLKRVAEPGGLSKDGSSAMYERVLVPAGEQRIAVRFSDDVRARATPYHREATVKLVPGQVLVIDFNAEKGGITLQ
ncbi:MAG: hypothetical protein IPL57_12690 [Rubrivivax sp.]|nr:hypothetical protein [Rubrivivax sp.]